MNFDGVKKRLVKERERGRGEGEGEGRGEGAGGGRGKEIGRGEVIRGFKDRGNFDSFFYY